MGNDESVFPYSDSDSDFCTGMSGVVAVLNAILRRTKSMFITPLHSTYYLLLTNLSRSLELLLPMAEFFETRHPGAIGKDVSCVNPPSSIQYLVSSIHHPPSSTPADKSRLVEVQHNAGTRRNGSWISAGRWAEDMMSEVGCILRR